MNQRKTIPLLLLLLLPVLAIAQEAETKPKWIEIHGYVKDLQSISFVDRADSLSSANLLHNRVNFKLNIAKQITARLEIRNRVFWGDQLKQVPDFGKAINQYNGLLNLSKLWVNEQTLVAHSAIDRMLLQYSSGSWDIQLGRQRINWGINTVWNPNDIFNAYNFLDFDYEERPGNDAIRLQRYFKNNATLELAYKPGKHAEESIAAILYKFNKSTFDYQALAGIYQEDIVLGGGWAGSIRNAGFKGEFSYFHSKKNMLDTTGIISFSIMADQTFKNDWYVAVSALFNSNPSGPAAMEGSVYGYSLSAKALFPYRYTFYLGVNKTISPVASVNFSIIYSPEKNALILFPTYSWNVAKNFDLDVTAQSFFAGINQRYKSQGNSFFLRGRWSF